ncbi:RNA polymerase sigma factor [Pleionea sediminis]|uniref:RNA polymerase sigma factor n=1 Tax=Pleionea sediminis TaxID=2569479 RepID=UPI001184E5FC|nr:RNA polymerase sigma factor [Pleionea sediminis]
MPSAAPISSDENLERELLNRINHSRDKLAMSEIYQRYRSRLGSFLMNMLSDSALVDEVYNDTMMVVWRKAMTFQETCKVSTWIYSIAFRTGLKARSRSQRFSFEECDENMEQKNPSDQLRYESQQLLTKALSELSPEHRAAVDLAYFQGYNYQEIAEITDSVESTIKTRIYYARQKLKQTISRFNLKLSDMEK